MQAVILAAGMGRRLGPYTSDQTKCMISLHGRTLIERALDSLVKLDLERIVLVVGYKAAGVMSVVGDEYQGVPVVYVHNGNYDKTNNIYSLYLARDYLVEDDTLLLESDIAFQESILTDLLAHPAPNVAVVDRYKSWMDGTVVTLLEDSSIERFIPKKDFHGTDVDSYFKTVNIYKLSAKYLQNTYVPFLGAYVQTMGNNEYYEQVLRVVTTLERQDLVAMPLDGQKWYEIDDIQDYMNAVTVLAPEDELYDSYQSRHGGYWRFPQILDFCYLVNPYFPPKDMREEMKRSFDVLLEQYPSSAKVNDHLAARMFGCAPEQIIVGNGAAELIAALGTDSRREPDRRLDTDVRAVPREVRDVPRGGRPGVERSRPGPRGAGGGIGGRRRRRTREPRQPERPVPDHGTGRDPRQISREQGEAARAGRVVRRLRRPFALRHVPDARAPDRVPVDGRGQEHQQELRRPRHPAGRPRDGRRGASREAAASTSRCGTSTPSASSSCRPSASTQASTTRRARRSGPSATRSSSS